MNAGRVEESQPHCRVTSGPVHAWCLETFGEISSFLKSRAAYIGLYFSLEMVGVLRGLKGSLVLLLIMQRRIDTLTYEASLAS